MDRVSSHVHSSDVGKSADYKVLLNDTHSVAEATAVVSNALLEKLASTLSMPLEDIDAGQPMHVFGVDSLVAVEIRNWLSTNFGSKVSVFEMLGKASVAELSHGIAGKAGKTDEG